MITNIDQVSVGMDLRLARRATPDMLVRHEDPKTEAAACNRTLEFLAAATGIKWGEEEGSICKVVAIFPDENCISVSFKKITKVLPMQVFDCVN